MRSSMCTCVGQRIPSSTSGVPKVKLRSSGKIASVLLDPLNYFDSLRKKFKCSFIKTDNQYQMAIPEILLNAEEVSS